MSRNKIITDFENRFPKDMDLRELRRWKEYFTQHAQLLQPKVRELAMKRVHALERAIAAKETEA